MGLRLLHQIDDRRLFDLFGGILDVFSRGANPFTSVIGTTAATAPLLGIEVNARHVINGT